MNIVVVSDSHGALGNLEAIKDVMARSDYLIHLGDCVPDALYIKNITRRNVCMVRGNCDFSPGIPTERVIEAASKRVFCTHGHRFNVKFSLDRLKHYCKKSDIDIVLFGHTHHPEVFWFSGKLFVNPGSMRNNRLQKGISYAVIRVAEGELNPRIVRL
jgi:putative phosphoesterase